jgi:hypothetical protein
VRSPTRARHAIAQPRAASGRGRGPTPARASSATGEATRERARADPGSRAPRRGRAQPQARPHGQAPPQSGRGEPRRGRVARASRASVGRPPRSLAGALEQPHRRVGSQPPQPRGRAGPSDSPRKPCAPALATERPGARREKGEGGSDVGELGGEERLEKMNRRGGGGLVGGTHALAAAAAGSARARVAGGVAGPWGQRGGPPRWARERKKMLGFFFYAPLLSFIYFFSSLSI